MLPSIVSSEIPGPNSKQLAQRLQRVESPGLTYLSADFPIFWEKSSETNIWDVDGNCFLDLNSAFGVSGIGHCNDSVIEAITIQAKELIHGMGDVHPPKIKVEFMEKLLDLFPPQLDQAILSCNGSDACESALKTAQVYTKKPGVIAFEYGYHGLGYGALDLTHKPHFRSKFTERLTEYTFHVPYPNSYRNGSSAGEQSLNFIKEVFHKNKELIGSVIIEPIQGRGGVIVPPTGFLKDLKEFCEENNLLLIFDEIYTGFCRTGKMFAFEEEDVLPDIICVGKTIGGGLPLSACITSSEIMNSWDKSNGEAIHTSTFLGNPLVCAAGLAVIEDLQKNNWHQKNKELGEYLKNKLTELNCEFIGEVRGKGLMLGMELVKDKHNKEPFPQLAEHLMVESLKKGLIVLTCGSQGHTLSFSPPFTITKEEIDFAVNEFSEILKTFIQQNQEDNL
ncbi:MAG: aspartate aminotransferase family protein [Candidatus Caenarcaniphilales bacterium]|nr:aspartate aminotransferase family protein [Candidatus Caenarcaniphilales bacterium]